VTTKINAILSLRPGAEWAMRGDDLEWLDQNQTQPTEAEITAEVARLQAEHEAKEYQRQRAAEYPDFRDYLDGVVKGDQAQIDAYIAACLAVKAKYPKPEQ
jgi:tRNA A37 N6-isopentenylltransferase MiaA